MRLARLGALLVAAVVDRAGYGRWTLTPLAFLQFNVLENLSVFYGTHPWHWYASQGVPVVVGTLLLPAALGLAPWASPPRPVQRLAWLAGWTVAAYSLLAHKEFRFVAPVVPLLAVVGGHGLAALGRVRGTRASAWVLLLVAATQLPLAVYLGLVHQLGVVDVTHWLRNRPPGPWAAAFLMPCHSTPWQAYIHQPQATLAFVTCEPPTRSVPRTLGPCLGGRV